MLGDGTQENPYQITTVAEFRQVCAINNAYGKLINDLDCNKEKYYEWTTVTVSCTEIDFNGYKLSNIYIKTDNYMFLGYSYTGFEKQLLKNGKILNIFENGSKYVCSKIALLNMAISINANNIKEIVMIDTKFNFCNVYIQRRSNAFRKAILYNCTATNSRFEIYATFEGFTYNDNNYTNVLASISSMSDCLLTGEAIIENANCELNLTTATMTNIICDLKAIGEGAQLRLSNASSTGLINVSKSNYNSGTLSNTKLLQVTDEQIRNPDYLNSIGFNVVKV